MSQQLIARSDDLKQLQDEGYAVSTHGAAVILRDVPYRNAAGEVMLGTLVSTLGLADDMTVAPVDDHVAFFAGEKPFRADGSPIPYVIGENLEQVYGDVAVDLQFSAKPTRAAEGKYRDYHHKMSTYVEILARGARSIDPKATARTFPVIVEDEEETVFNYVDSAASRAGLEQLTQRLQLDSVAIVGLGGTGSYILDLLAKTPIGSVHLFDGDVFHQHNAFRAPGAPSNEELRARPAKVERFQSIYSAMRREIVPHPYPIDDSNVGDLAEMDFVFIAIDDGDARRLLAEKLEEFGVDFIDVGLGVKEKNGFLTGLVRTTTITKEHRSRKLPYTGGGEEDYERNIQIAELNALNAVLAVMRWKRLVGFYGDVEPEHQSLYQITSNYLVNTDA